MTTVNEEGKALVEQGTFNKEKALRISRRRSYKSRFFKHKKERTL